MKPKTKNNKGRMAAAIILGVVFLILGAILFIGDADYLLGGEAQNLNDYEAQPPKDIHVQTDSYLVLGNFAETTHMVNGVIPVGKDQHYAILVGDGVSEDYSDYKIYIVTVKNKKTIEKLDALANDEYAMFDDAFCIEGQVTTPDPEIGGYLVDALNGSTWADFDYYTTISIDMTQTRAHGWLMIGFSLVFGVAFIVIFVRMHKQNKAEKNLAYASAAPAAGQPGNPYINPVTGQPYDASTINPVTGQPYNVQVGDPYGAQQGQPYGSVGGDNTPRT